MMKHAIVACRAVVACLAVPLLAMPANAGIRCNSDYQVVGGSEVSTPYCRDNNLARLARQHGVKVSDREVRENPNRKSEICRFMGSNIEVRSTCSEDNSHDSSGH